MNPPEYSTTHQTRLTKNVAASKYIPHRRFAKKYNHMQEIYVDMSNFIGRDGFVGQVMCRNDSFSMNLKKVDGENFNEHSNVPFRITTSVPLNMMPPPLPINMNNGNFQMKRLNRQGNWKSGNDLRCNSPHSTESDDSFRSASKDCLSSSGDTIRHKGKNKNVHAENSLISKFSNSAPNIYQQNCISNAHFKPKYYTNSSSTPPRRHERKKYHSTDIGRRVYGLMERFTAKSSIFQISANPDELLHVNNYDTLNQSIWDMYRSTAQTKQTYLKKLDLWRKVYLSIEKVLVRYGLFVVGSTMSGLGLNTSDIDMCLMVRPYSQDPYMDALNNLQNICNMFKTADYVKSAEVIMAKVPILKFCDNIYGFEVDLNCNNSVGIRNTHLLNCYARLDWRVRPLVTIVKLWAQEHGINDAKEKTISSYSLALMVIFCLQCGVNPPALPSLQNLYPEKFRPDLEIHKIDMQEDMPTYVSNNRQSLGELLIGFLRYYTFFDYNRFAISVREASLLLKEDCRFIRSPKNDVTQWRLLCIEEPFDLTNTARSVYDVDIFEHIKNVFHISYEALLDSKNLSSILRNCESQR